MTEMILNVRQIMEYPLKGEASSADAVLLQTGALGGPYAWTTAYGLVVGALDWPGSQLGVGIPLPGNAVDTGVLATSLLTPLGCTFGWNWYHTAAGRAPLSAGNVAQMCYDGSVFAWGAGADPEELPTLMWLANDGALNLPFNTLTVARDPVNSFEVATKGYTDDEISDLNSALRQFIQNLINGLQDLYDNSTVWSWNGRTGNVSLTLSDITSVGGAPINNPSFVGVPTVPTPPLGDGSYQIPNTAWVDTAIQNAIDYVINNEIVSSFNGRHNDVVLLLSDITGAGGAPLNSPAFTGLPTAPTPASGNDSDRIATTAFVANAIANAVFNIEEQLERVVIISPTAPVNPHPGLLWWDSSKGPGGGTLFIWFADVNSAQWVDASPSEPGPMGPPGRIHVDDDPPERVHTGTAWLDTRSDTLRIWEGDEWVSFRGSDRDFP